MPWRRETKVVADFRIISAKRAADIDEMGGIKSESQRSPSGNCFFSSTDLVGLLFALQGGEESSFSTLRRCLLEGWHSVDVVGDDWSLSARYISKILEITF